MAKLYRGSLHVRKNHTLSPKIQILFTLCLTSVGLGIVSTSTVWTAIIGMGLGGFSYGYGQPSVNFLISNYCARSIQGIAFGFKQAAVPLCALLSSLMVPLVSIPLGWQPVFWGGTGACLIYALIVAMNRKLKKAPATTAARSHQPQFHIDSQLVLLIIVGVLGGAIGNTLGGYLIPTVTSHGISLVTASAIASAAAISNILTRIISGFLSDRFNISPYIILIIMFSCGTLGIILLTVNSPAILTIGAVLAFGGGWGWAGLLQYTVTSMYKGYEKQSSSYLQMGVSLGAAFGPLLFGLVSTALGLNVSWYFVALSSLTVTGIVIYIKSKRKTVLTDTPHVTKNH